VANAWLEAIAVGRGAPRVEEEIAELERVQVGDVQSVAQTVLAPQGLRWVISGAHATATQAVDGNHLGALRRMVVDW
jgi:hypothetical protein